MFSLSRRSFLTGIAASAASPLLAQGSVRIDPTLIALVADPHVSGKVQPDRTRIAYQKVVNQILALNPRPAFVVNFGDCSYDAGLTIDYQAVKRLSAPLEDAGMKIIIGMGNHDRRKQFQEIYPAYSRVQELPNRIVSVLETPHVDLIMLDSCLEGPVGGAIDSEQMEWLEAKLLSSRKPIIVGSHHPPQELKLQPILRKCPMLAGYIYGHHHSWTPKNILLDPGTGRMLPTLCLPSTGCWGDIGFAMLQTDGKHALAALHQSDYFMPRPLPPEQRPAKWDARVKKNQGKTFEFPYLQTRA